MSVMVNANRQLPGSALSQALGMFNTAKELGKRFSATSATPSGADAGAAGAGSDSSAMAGGAADAADAADAAGAAEGSSDAAVLLASRGGKVPGRAPVPGDSSKNDIISARVSPGELIVPRSKMQGGPKSVEGFVLEAMHRRMGRK